MAQQYYSGTQADVAAALAQINTNSGFPDADTKTWDNVTQAYQQDFWFISQPPESGYKSSVKTLTQETMIAGVVNVTLGPATSNWWPPAPAPPN
jgi:hypothetical protein